MRDGGGSQTDRNRDRTGGKLEGGQNVKNRIRGSVSREQSRVLCPSKNEGPFGELLEQSSRGTSWDGA